MPPACGALDRYSICTKKQPNLIFSLLVLIQSISKRRLYWDMGKHSKCYVSVKEAKFVFSLLIGQMIPCCVSNRVLKVLKVDKSVEQ